MAAACRLRHVMPLLVAAAVLLAAVPARAASVVFTRDGNVWLAAPDGTGQSQVTLDGTPAAPYRSPSQADDGTIVAEREKLLYRMRQNGEPLNPPVGAASPLGGISNPVVSPDGTKVGFYYVTAVCCPVSTRFGTLYTYSDRFTDPSVFGVQQSFRFSSWIGNARALGHFGTQANFDDVGGGDNSYSDWFYESDYLDPTQPTVNLHDGEVSAQGDKLAAVRADDLDGAGVIWRYKLDAVVARGTPGAVPTPTPVCEISGAAGYKRPSWAPDGRSLAWPELDGIHVGLVPATLLNADGSDNCGAISERLVIPGGDAPDVGPADSRPPTRTPPGSRARASLRRGRPPLRRRSGSGWTPLRGSGFERRWRGGCAPERAARRPARSRPGWCSHDRSHGASAWP